MLAAGRLTWCCTELELYDEVLDRRLWTHFSEGLSWQQTLASRRRTEPINAQKLIEDLLLREREFESEDTPPMLDVDIDPGTRGRCECAFLESFAQPLTNATRVAQRENRFDRQCTRRNCQDGRRLARGKTSEFVLLLRYYLSCLSYQSVPALLEKADRIEAVAAVDSRLAP